MAHNILSEKLDAIKKEELGFSFSEEALWMKMEAQLGTNSGINVRWWLAAACCFIVVFLAPITMQLENMPLVAETITKEQALIATPGGQGLELTPKKLESLIIPVADDIQSNHSTLALAQVEMKPIIPLRAQSSLETKVKMKPQFAAKDISIIQASLGRPSIGTGRSLTVRAQLQSFSTQSKLNKKELKIKLYEKH